MLSKYETVLIVKPDLPEDQFEVVKTRAVSAITTTGGHEIVFQDWGKKRLAYPIKKSPKGNYLYFRYLAEGAGVAELERNLKVLDSLLRFLTVKLEDRVDAEGYDFEGERSTIFPFGVKPREPVAETPKQPRKARRKLSRKPQKPKLSRKPQKPKLSQKPQKPKLSRKPQKRKLSRRKKLPPKQLKRRLLRSPQRRPKRPLLKQLKPSKKLPPSRKHRKPRAKLRPQPPKRRPNKGGETNGSPEKVLLPQKGLQLLRR